MATRAKVVSEMVWLGELVSIRIAPMMEPKKLTISAWLRGTILGLMRRSPKNSAPETSTMNAHASNEAKLGGANMLLAVA
eukprot:CAMPEP_0184339568 /NCGR_PEP_ID=MMETSP1089-20130417/8231_1 /TAXON_ID=38269 ORGANISM="Gloeochaete wittrockiana, Strain SAG46.84" /NCGR_SAMPLE_ID=MMETSP1089 /ASSEMBLY_ACC=CAM_ASM_000445 /LENGTH=79 /DNA_ID=CAMNT_0026666873 /DNA_START=229 /DNA_END=468 /DNA_ORIENTATION=-